MAAAQSYFERKNSSAIRPGISQVVAPASPHTPQRTISSTFSSPGANYRAEEEYVILEIGTRYVRAGLAGDSRPRCAIKFGGEEARRVGDYRKWLPGSEDTPKIKQSRSEWGLDHELWRMDVRHTDLGLVEDKLERAVREAYTQHLLLDSKTRRILLVMPSVMPHPLLSTALTALFNSLQVPVIMLLPSPLLSVLAAGQRSGLVVDIGWHDIIFTTVYEFREIGQSRTSRGMKTVILEMAKMLGRKLKARDTSGEIREDTWEESDDEGQKLDVDFEYAEEVTVRLAWCRKASSSDFEPLPQRPELSEELKNLSIANSGTKARQDDISDEEEDGDSVSLPALAGSSRSLEVPFSQLSRPVESAFFTDPSKFRDQDDHEHTASYLLYEVLLELLPDIRSICMANIIFTGGGSNIPGLKSRLLDELRMLVSKRGWDRVWGKASDEQRGKSHEKWLRTRKLDEEKELKNKKKLEERQQRLEEKKKKFEETEEPKEGKTIGQSPSTGDEIRASSEVRTDEDIKSTSIKQSADGEEEDEEEREGGGEEPPTPAAFLAQEEDEIDEKLRKSSSKGVPSIVSGEIRAVETLGPWTGASIAASMRLKGIVEIEREAFLQNGLAGAKREVDVSVAKSRQSIGLGLGARPAGNDSAAWTLGTWA